MAKQKKESAKQKNPKLSKAMEGNKNAIGNSGKPKYIDSPETFKALFNEFAAWCKDNPRTENVFSQKECMTFPIERERPLTWDEFDTWLDDVKGIIHSSEDYRQNKNNAYTEFSGVITYVEKKIRGDKFTGAAVGIYNPNIIARDLGLADKVDGNNVNKNYNYNSEPLTPEKIREINSALENDY